MLPPRQQGGAGFGAATQQPPAGPPPPPGVAADPAAAQAAGEPQPNVSPEEQQLYNDFVGMSLMHLYDEATMPDLVEKLKAQGSQNPKLAVGETSAMIAFAVLQKSIDAGQRVPEYVIASAGREIVGAVAELAARSGLPEMSQEDIDGAYYVAADEMRDMMDQAGLLDEGVVEQDMAALEEMEANGELDPILAAMGGGAPAEGQPPADPAAAPPPEGPLPPDAGR